MKHCEVSMKLPYSEMNFVNVKKRKAGVEVHTAITNAVRKKYKKEVNVASRFLPETPDVHEIDASSTAEALSSQEAEAIVQPAMDPQAEVESLKAQTQLLMSQAISDLSVASEI